MKKFRAVYRDWKPLQKTGFWLVCAVLCYTLLGFLVAPPILKAVLEKKIPELLQRPVKIETIRLNPYSLSATVEGFDLRQKEDHAASFVAFDRVYLNLEALSLFKQALIVKSFSLEGPRIAFSRVGEATFSFSDLLASPEAGAPPAEEAKPLLFSVNNIEIINGEILFDDRPKARQHRVSELNLAIPTVSNLPVHVDLTVQPRFSAQVNGTPFALSGGSKPFADSLATEVELNVKDLDLIEYLAYVPNPSGLTLASARLDLQTTLAFQVYPNGTSRLTLTGPVSLSDLEVVDRDGTSYLRVPQATATLAPSNLLNRELRLAEVTIRAPQMELTRRPDGSLLPLDLLAAGDETGTEMPEVASGDAPSAAPPLRLTIDSLQLRAGEVGFRDEALAAPASLLASGIDLAVTGYSTIPDTTAKLDLTLQFNRAGSLAVHGSLASDPLDLTLTTRLEALQLKPFQPYVSEFARVAIADGHLELNGDLSFRQKADGAPELLFTGQSALVGLATADPVAGADLVTWGRLDIKAIRLATEPLRLAIDEVALEQPFVKVLVREDGTVNLATLIKKGEESPSTPGDSESSGAPTPEPTAQRPEVAAGRPEITINRVLLRNGEIDIEDRAIDPTYGVTIDQLEGTVAGLSSDREKRATVELKARVDQQSPLAIKGTMNPLSETPTADIEFDFTDFNMPPLSPYTGKYVGYQTGKGKLHLDLEYLIDGSRLESSNRIFLDQFTLGQTVDSPDAISAPVGLAVALLKNRSGEITLDIPVAGDLEDPEFSVGGVIAQVIFNLIAKAATSPFALLGALIPEGVDIQHLPYDPGSADLNQAALEKLEVVATVLTERPGVKMDLAGRVDPQLDRQALARERLQQRVKLAKIHATGGKVPAEGELPQISVGVEEYPQYLEQVYRAALKAASAAEGEAEAVQQPADPAEKLQQMENFLLNRIDVTEADLRLLAIERANRALSHLVETRQVEPGRLFVVEPQLQPPEGDSELENHALVQLLIH